MLRHGSVELRLPEEITACLFDLAGVPTDTAKLHAVMWQMFDAYLLARATRTGGAVRPFKLRADEEQFVEADAQTTARRR